MRRGVRLRVVGGLRCFLEQRVSRWPVMHCAGGKDAAGADSVLARSVLASMARPALMAQLSTTATRFCSSLRRESLRACTRAMCYTVDPASDYAVSWLDASELELFICFSLCFLAALVVRRFWPPLWWPPLYDSPTQKLLKQSESFRKL